jgi:protein ImuB
MWVCLYFHTLSLQVFARKNEEPFALSDCDKVFFCNESARRSGIKPGMKLAAAFALDSRLRISPRNEAKEGAALQSIALTAMQFTSAVSLAPSAVLLEAGGSLSLFGGLPPLLEKIREALREWAFVMASSPTPSGALLLARAGREIHIAETGQLKTELARLPVELLDCPPEVLQALKDIGMRRIGDVLALPRDGLARRFGQELLDALDRPRGNLPDARPPFALPANYANKLELPAPVVDAEALLFGARRLIGELAGFLSAKNCGVLKLDLKLYHEDASVTCVPITLSLATRDPAHLISLVRERLFNLTLPSRVEALSLEASEVVPLQPRSLSLLADDRENKENHAQLIERLRARLGADAVVTLQPFPDHRPERAWRYRKEEDEGGRMKAEKTTEYHPLILHPSSLIPHPPEHPRPLWLLDPPSPLKAQGETPWLDGPLTLLSGPERIESGWWDGNDIARDYFVACDSEGAKFWVFLVHDSSLRGAVYRDEAISESRSNRDRCPRIEPGVAMTERRWFLHGIFA